MALDFLILYEHTVREYESDLLLKLELERRGYKVEIRQLLDPKYRRLFREDKPEVLVASCMYDNEAINSHVYNNIGRCNKIVNLHWEQMLSDTQEEGDWFNMNGNAKKCIQTCWGKRTAARLQADGCRRFAAENLQRIAQCSFQAVHAIRYAASYRSGRKNGKSRMHPVPAAMAMKKRRWPECRLFHAICQRLYFSEHVRQRLRAPCPDGMPFPLADDGLCLSTVFAPEPCHARGRIFRQADVVASLKEQGFRQIPPCTAFEPSGNRRRFHGGYAPEKGMVACHDVGHAVFLRHAVACHRIEYARAGHDKCHGGVRFFSLRHAGGRFTAEWCPARAKRRQQRQITAA